MTLPNLVTMATASPLRRLRHLHKKLLPGIELGTLGLPVRRLNHYAIFCNWLIHRYTQVCTFFNTSTKSWRGYIFTAVCLCVCVCVSVCLSVCSAFLVNKIPAEPMHRFSLHGCFWHWLGPYCNW